MVYVADTYNHTIRKITPAGEVSTLAGTAGNSGSADGVGAAARFNWPRCIAVDSVGNIYVGDLDNHTIRKITPSGQVTTLAGSPGIAGSTDGIGSAARFYEPDGVAIDYAGNVYVSDWHSSAIRKITSTGFVTTLAGSARVDGSADGVGPAARFAGPLGVGIDSVGNVYVADTGNSSIRRITPSGNVSTYAGAAGAFGRVDGVASEARFYQPSGVAIDNAGNVYVADTWNNVIRKITAAGMVSTLAGTGSIGSTDGNGDTASFGFCELVSVGHPGVTYVRVCDAAGIATDSAGNVYVADLFNSTIRKITPAGVVTTLAGSARIAGSADGVGSAARFNFPRGVATDNQANVYVADTENHTIRKITPSGQVTTLAGSPGIAGSTDGIGSAARFNHPRGIATDGAGKVYVADTDNHTIRKIDPAGGVTTLVGVAGMIGFTPGALPGALANPQGVAVSGTTLYVTLFNGVAVVTNLQ
jgi:sugar lactone lactonase YvrE